jgi:hypothetical protein
MQLMSITETPHVAIGNCNCFPGLQRIGNAENLLTSLFETIFLLDSMFSKMLRNSYIKSFEDSKILVLYKIFHHIFVKDLDLKSNLIHLLFKSFEFVIEECHIYFGAHSPLTTLTFEFINVQLI